MSQSVDELLTPTAVPATVPLNSYSSGGYTDPTGVADGKLVYQTTDFSHGWNGTYNGMPADSGTFVWMASYRNADTKALQFKKGFVIVLH